MSNPRSPRTRLERFGGDDTAMVAVEFAMISPFFIALVLITLMTCVIYMARSQLDAATQAGARAVMVGTATNSTQLQSAICGAVGGFFTCSNMMINLNTYANLGSMDASAPTVNYDGSGGVTNNWGASFGASGSILVLQVMYQFPMIGTNLFNLATQANGTDLLISTAVFIHE